MKETDRRCDVFSPWLKPQSRRVLSVKLSVRIRLGRPIFMPPKHFERCTPLVWEKARCNSGWGLQIPLVLPNPKRHDVEIVASAGANPATSTNLRSPSQFLACKH